jgi:hypothetical protein
MKVENFPENASDVDPPSDLDLDAPQVTVEAVMYELREHGLDALNAPNARERLGALSRKQHREVLARLIRLRPRDPRISDELLVYLEGLGQ